ncbi:MAG: 50S ribosomal protein L9 [Saprospirales bacterium]|nr:50S ribosomal protein L9 [Saprospirales bacterium]MBK8921980.1 50S ribosomal protein L9 [Saprospirales bacterium]
MEIILLDHIDKVGDKHDVVKVKDGFGRNYLIPRGLAIVANKANMARLEGMKKQTAKKESAKVGTYQEYAAQLAAGALKIVAKAGESGRLFGSVTAQNLVDAIQEKFGIAVEKRLVIMPEEVKELGAYEATIKFHPEVMAPVKFEVVTGEEKEEGADDAE